MNGRNYHNGSAYFEIVEKEIIEALRTWLKGDKVKIDTVGYAEDIKLGKKRLQKLEQEKGKLSTQMDNAFNLVEQGVYTLEVFQDRRAKLTLAMEDLDIQIEKLQKEILEEIKYFKGVDGQIEIDLYPESVK